MSFHQGWTGCYRPELTWRNAGHALFTYLLLLRQERQQTLPATPSFRASL